MDRGSLLEALWVDCAALVALHRPAADKGCAKDGRTACGCSWCRVSGTLRELDAQFGMDLAKAANERLRAKRAEVAKAGVV